ncbi:uncharacterized protein si:ch211-214p13.7 isoform X2 [Scyliorhinus canicula]|uniref:uncharacterized protein si:ch211-214p13.7 isoform X2 n=1 Tax=Scyliorhinus canicula TaxID=7830 RepID=UPI0018F776BE|nr:uncharacterized protein si:ch211-214p13.7 isoform X2 [Scyliorhinus canicula]
MGNCCKKAKKGKYPRIGYLSQKAIVDGDIQYWFCCVSSAIPIINSKCVTPALKMFNVIQDKATHLIGASSTSSTIQSLRH